MNTTPTPPPPAPVAPYSSRLAFEFDAFVYKDHRYMYSDVRHVEFAHGYAIVTPRGAAPQREYSSTLRVGLANGKWVGIRLITLTHKTQKTLNKVWHDAVLRAAERLSVLTFNFRMDAIMLEVGRVKYIRQGRYQVSTRGDLFKRYAFCHSMRSEQVNNMLFHDRLVSLRKPKRWWKRAFWSMVRAQETIDLTRDRDCFMYFLRYYTGLYWPNETLRLWRGKAADGSTERKAESTAGQASGQGAHEVPLPPKPVATSVQHLAVLGLTVDATWDEVRTAYRALARKHHPDLMRGRGASDADMKLAEEALKSINHAYGWLEDFYRLKPKR